jgi:cytochrome c-type biogenesis protein CcmH/NrfF
MARWLCLIAALLALALPVGADAATSYTDVEDEVMCVSCNVPLNVAESPQADAQKAEIRRLVDQGLSKQQIKNALVDQYGARVLALPKDDGFGIVVYVVPIVVALFLIALTAVLLPRWKRRGDEAHKPAPPTLSAADSRRLDADLRDFDS